MDEIEYSPDAIDVLNQFYEVEIVVLVEGDEDTVFWSYLFEKFYEDPVIVRGVGGKPNLERYLQDISESARGYFVAMDRDYEYLYTPHNHDHVVCTFGHSMENSLICGRTLSQVIQSYALVGADKITPDECQAWLTDEASKLKELVCAEIDNYNCARGVTILGDNCSRHHTNTSSYTLSEDRLSDYLATLGFHADPEILTRVESEIENGRKQASDLVRGHYLFSMCFRYVRAAVKRLRKKITLSNEVLLGALFVAFKLHFTADHLHYQYYESEIGSI